MSFNKIKKGPMIANSTMNVAGTATFNNMITALSSFNISGNTTMMGNSTFGSTLNVSGNSTMMGASTFGSTLNIMGAMIASNTNVLSGASTFGSTLNIMGALIASSTSILTGAVTTGSTLNINGAMIAANTSILSGASTHSSTLNIVGALTAANTNVLSGASTFGSTLNIMGALTAVSTSILTGASTFASTLNVSGALIAASTSILSGASTFASTLNVSGNTSIMGTMAVGISVPSSIMQIHSALVSGQTGLWESSDLRFTYNAGAGSMWDLGRIAGYVAAGTSNSTSNWPGGLLFQTKPATTIGALAATRMVIDSNGNVGIGNTAPLALLHVSGNSIMNGATTLGSTLNITGGMTAANTSILSGASTFGSTLNIAGALTASSTSILSGAVTTGSTLNITGALTAANTSILTGATTVGSTLTVSNNISQFGSTTFLGGSLGGTTDNTYGMGLKLAYNTTGNRQIAFTDTGYPAALGTSYSYIRIGVGAYVGAPFIDAQTVGMTAATISIGNSAGVILNGPVTGASTLYYAGAMTAGSTLNVAGALTAASTNILTGASTFGSTLNISGALTAATTSIMSGASTHGSTLNIAGTLTAATTSILSGASTFGSTLNVAGILTAANQSVLSGASTFGSTLNVAGVLTAASTSIMSGASTYGSSLFVSGTSILQGAATTSSSLNVTGSMGIGTTTPSALLHINRSTANYDPGLILTNNTTGVLTCGLAGGAGSYAGNAVAGDAVFRNDDSTKKVHLLAGAGNAVMTITNTNVGVGTITPLQKLHIENGNIGINSASEITGKSSLFFYNNPYMGSNNAAKTAIITEGINNYTQSKLHLCVNGVNDLTTSASISDAKLTITPSGYVGIGSTNPSSLLQFGNTVTNRGIVLWDNGTSSTDHQYYGFGINANVLRYQTAATSTSHLFYAANSATTSSMLMSINGTGNVGIGTTTPYSMLHMAKSFTADNDTSGMITFQNTNPAYFDWMVGPQVLSNQALFSIRGGNDSYTALSNLFNILGSGNVGIATTTPAYKLDVAGDINFTGNIYKNGTLFSGGGGSSQWTTTGNNIYYNTGNVAIGTTNPTAILDISNATADNYLRVRVNSATYSGISLTETSWYGQTIRYNQTDDSLRFSVQDGTPTFTDKMILTYTGSLGVGTMAPVGTLDVQNIVRMGNYSGGSYDNIEFVRGTGSGQYPNIRCQNNYFGLYVSDAGGWCGDSQVGDMVMRPYGAFRVGVNGANSALTVSSASRVGIGVTTPAYKLDIAGNMHVGNGDDSMTYYGPNSTWNASLAIGAGTNKGIAQVLTTNGNLHLDSALNSNMYYGHYTRPYAQYFYTLDWDNGGSNSNFYNYVRWWRQYSNVNGDAMLYMNNASGGASAYFNLIVSNNAGNTNNFMNSSTRISDGGYNCYTTRNDTNGGVRFQSSYGGFSSYGPNNPGGANYTQAIYNSAVNTTAYNSGSWDSSGYTIFCNTSTPSGSQPGLGLGSNNYDANYITSLSPGVRWMVLYISAGTTAFVLNGSQVGYTVPSGGANVSDAREKLDIKDLKTSKSLERIMMCKPKYYKRKFYDKDRDGNPIAPPPEWHKDFVNVGLLAQDVKEFNPHCLSEWDNRNVPVTDDDNAMRYGICYDDFIIHLIGATQEQQKLIVDLQQKVSQDITSLKEQVTLQDITIQQLTAENTSLKEQVVTLQAQMVAIMTRLGM